MNACIPLTITLLLCFTLPSAFAEECSGIAAMSFEKKEQTFMELKKNFIETLKPSEHLDQIRKLATNPSQLDEVGDLTLRSLPGTVQEHYPEIPITVLDDFTEQIEELERFADCFHFGKRSKGSLMKLRYRKVKETDSPYIGFLLPKEQDQPRKVKIASSSSCQGKHCDFTVKNVDDLDKDIILLVHRPARLSTPVIHTKPIVDPKTDTTKRLPERAFLLELDLKKVVKHFFSTPEIYMHLTYYNSDQPIREDTIEIPWAKKKGVNEGNTELIIWLDADSVQLTLMENDSEIPFRLFGKILSRIVKIGLQLAGAFDPEIGHIQNALGILSNRTSTESADFYHALDRMNAADMLDTVRLQRNNLNTFVPMKSGVAKMVLKPVYTSKTGMNDEL